jgi:hypothetical protein
VGVVVGHGWVGFGVGNGWRGVWLESVTG